MLRNPALRTRLPCSSGAAVGLAAPPLDGIPGVVAPVDGVDAMGQANSHAGRNSRATGRVVPPAFTCERLEARCLLSSVFTPEEVYLSELINRARMDPAAEGIRVGIDMADGLTSDELALLGPVEPLALDADLTAAARAHSLDMITRGFFDDINPDGLNPTQRAQAAGYSGVAGEVIASGQPAIDSLYEFWMDSVPNRINLLSLITSFDGSFHYDQLGPGFATEIPDAEPHYTAMLGDPGVGTTAWLLGVVYDDADSDAFYSIGEGAGGIRIEVAEAASPEITVATFTTDDAGNYQMELGDGSWIVTFIQVSTGELVEKAVTTDGQNVKLDALISEFEPPVGDGGGGGGDGGGDGGGGSGGGGDGGDGGDGATQDDHADDGDYFNATLLTLNADHAGSDTGLVDTEADTDLFYLTADVSGTLTATLDASAGPLVGQLTLKSDAGLALIVEDASSPGEIITLNWNVVAGSQYFLVVGASERATIGGYVLSLELTANGGSDGGGGGDGGDNGGGGGDWVPDPDTPPVDATSDAAGLVTIVRTDDRGRPIAYQQQADGSWSRIDLVAEAGGPTPEGRFSTFVDRDTGRVTVVSAASTGLTLYSTGEDGSWRVRSLSAEKGTPPIVTKPVTFTGRAGLVYIAGLDEDGNLITYYNTGGFDRLGSAWGYEDLSNDHLAPQGMNLPPLQGGTLISYVTGWNALTIAGLDARGRIFAVWRSANADTWSLANLSNITGAPVYQGSISAYLTPWNGINIAGTDANGDLSVVWWVPSFGGEWKLSKLNRILGGPKLGEGTIASWVTPWGGLNVSGLTEAGKVVVYWWTPSSGGWQITALSDYIPNVDPPAVGVIGHTSQAGVISIMGLSEVGDLVRYWWQTGEPWAGENLSAA